MCAKFCGELESIITYLRPKFEVAKFRIVLSIVYTYTYTPYTYSIIPLNFFAHYVVSNMVMSLQLDRAIGLLHKRQLNDKTNGKH